MSLVLIMKLVTWVIAALWGWKAVTAFFGLRSIPNLLEPQFDVAPVGEPRITVIVPARDEGANIAACLESLLGQDYSNLNVIAIDDRSSDETGAMMDAMAAGSTRMTVRHITELPAGWLGKTHAMALGAHDAMEIHGAQYLLFTDADVIFDPQAIRRALAQAVVERADHFVLPPTPILRTAGEAMILGFLQVIGLWAARPWRVADPKAKRDAFGIGAFNLLRTEAYRELGGFEALRMQVVEDVTLAWRVKELGLRQRVAFGPGLVTVHWAAGAMGVVKVMTKNLFAVFAFRPAALLGASAFLAMFCLEPFVGLCVAGARLPAALALIAIAALYVLSRLSSRTPAWTALAFPLSVVLVLYALLRSMIVTLRDGGVTWRGTFYSLEELRANVKSLR